MKEDRQSASGVELFLDNRQVFLLFFASAVVLSLVFTLGVVVGKRVAARSAPTPSTDPLTLLDQMGGHQGDDNLTFHEALTGSQPPTAGSPDAGTPAEPPGTDPAPQPRHEDAPKAAVARKNAPRPGQEQGAKPPKQRAPRVVASKEPKQSKPDIPEDKSASETAAPEEGKLLYTLQLSSFQDRHEAELFMQKLREGGLKPYLVPTTIPGRGVWYRVRLGSYGSWDDALAAKQVFERKQKIIAYVAKTIDKDAEK